MTIRIRRVLRIGGILAAVIAMATVFFVWRPLDVLQAANRVSLWRAGFKSGYVQLGQQRIHFWAGGEGQPLVMLHGIGGEATNFTPIMPAFAAHNRVFAVDLLGFGQSDKPVHDDYSMALQAETIRQFLESQRLGRASFLGFSMGGWVSLKFASQWPQQVERLILVSSPGVRYESKLDPKVFNPKNLDDMYVMFRVMSSAELPPSFILRDILRLLRSQEVPIRRTADSLLRGDDLMDGKLRDRVTMPVLLVWGKEDRVIPLSVAETLRQEMPQSVLTTFDGCAHDAIVECSDRMLPHLERFLGASPPPSGTTTEVPAPGKNRR